MASIQERKNKDGTSRYKVAIRKNDVEICQTFYTLEDAKLYEFYKERLIDNMKNFDVPLKERVTLEQVIELKRKSVPESDRHTLGGYIMILKKIQEILPNKKFVHEFTFDDWINAAKKIFSEPVYKGAKTENGKRSMSVATLRRYFAMLSAAFSHAQSQGIELDNHPLKVMQTYINPMHGK